MKLGNPWTFGILFICVFCYLAWNNFTLPKVFWSKTEETKAIVIESQSVPRLRHLGQLITFAYQVGDSIYFGKHKVNHAKYPSRPIGSTLRLKYALNNPSDFEVLEYYRFHNYTKRHQYIWQEGFGDYDELYFENGIVKMLQKTDQGRLTNSFIGHSKTNADTTIVVPIFKPFTSENTVMYLERTKSYQKEILLDTLSKKRYWRISKK